MPLAGTCTSTIAGAEYLFLVDGVPATSVTCPMPGYGVRVEPSIDSCYGIPACTYREPPVSFSASGGCAGGVEEGCSRWGHHDGRAIKHPACACASASMSHGAHPHPPPLVSSAAGQAYTVSSACPSDEVAEWHCDSPTCPRVGAIVNLEGLCTNRLACAKIAYTVNGAAAISFRCPVAGRSVTIVPRIDDFGRNPDCDYVGPPIVVNCELWLRRDPRGQGHSRQDSAGACPRPGRDGQAARARAATASSWCLLLRVASGTALDACSRPHARTPYPASVLPCHLPGPQRRAPTLARGRCRAQTLCARLPAPRPLWTARARRLSRAATCRTRSLTSWLRPTPARPRGRPRLLRARSPRM